MQNEETIFEVAIQKPNPAERAAYLEGACGGDPELRRRVEALVQNIARVLDAGTTEAAQAQGFLHEAEALLAKPKPSSRK